MYKREDLIWIVPLVIAFVVTIAVVDPHCFDQLSKYVQDARRMRCLK